MAAEETPPTLGVVCDGIRSIKAAMNLGHVRCKSIARYHEVISVVKKNGKVVSGLLVKDTVDRMCLVRSRQADKSLTAERYDWEPSRNCQPRLQGKVNSDVILCDNR